MVIGGGGNFSTGQKQPKIWEPEQLRIGSRRLGPP